MIDSGQVPRGNGEKQPGEGDEIVSETVCLQRAGASSYAFCFVAKSFGTTSRNVWLAIRSYERSEKRRMGDCVPIEE